MTDLMREIGRRGPSYEAGEPYRETPRPPAPTGRSAPTAYYIITAVGPDGEGPWGHFGL